MLTINADDWGRSVAETNAALNCFKAGRITSVSAMVFMIDSERAAELAKENRVETGLHLNFSEAFSAKISERLRDCQERTLSYLKQNKYSQLFYNPFLRSAFSYSYRAQVKEFMRLFGKRPSHVDGHHHMHLCANVVFSNLIPAGTKTRRNFSFWSGEKSSLNRFYRALIDRRLARRYRLTDYFFDLTQCIEEKKLERAVSLAKYGSVELMTHPVIKQETDYLMSDEFSRILQTLGPFEHQPA